MRARRLSAACISPPATAEYPISPDQKSVCTDVANFSVEDTLAVRVIVEYAFGGAAERTHRGRARSP